MKKYLLGNKMFNLCKKLLYVIFYTYILCRFFSLYPEDISPTRNISFKVNNVEGYEQFIIANSYIYTDKGVFINRNSLIKFKFNSNDLLNYLFKKHNNGSHMECNAIISGYRIYWPITILPNILEIQCE